MIECVLLALTLPCGTLTRSAIERAYEGATKDIYGVYMMLTYADQEENP